jgi:predicted transposase YbfD/YdcC
MQADFPYARSLTVVRNCRTIKKTQKTTTESHYYLSSLLPEYYQPAQWLDLVRGHWAGVEIRNHWRRDVLMGEDGSRSRNPNLLANLALLRSALFTVLSEHLPDSSLQETLERLHSRPSLALNLLSQ